MRFENKWANKFWRFSTSFQLGIPVLVVITVMIAYGTIIESQYDAYAAKRLVYESRIMFVAMILLIYNLTAVMIDRLPWVPRHYPFICVHIGIITVILGGSVTQKYGIDGSMSVPIAGKNNFVALPQTDLVVYATFDGDKYTKMFENEVDFYKEKPSTEKPFTIALHENTIRVIDYVPYARLTKKVKPSVAPQAGSSIRFQIMNANVKQVESITQTKKNKTNQFNLGPAQIHLGAVLRKDLDKNEIFLTPKDKDSVTYALFRKGKLEPDKTGTLQIGNVIETGWMGLEFRLLDYLQLATEEWDVATLPRPTPLTTSAIQIERGADKHWLVLNDILKIFGTEQAFLITYQNRRLDIGFPIELKNFKVVRYEGSQKAMSYESDVSVGAPSNPITTTISMNEPLKHAGFTIYQASFQEDEVTRQPTASVFSINYDPGRWIKYLGSLILTLGIIWLFYQRRKRKIAL